MGRDYDGTRAFHLCGKAIFHGFRDFHRIDLTFILWVLILYDVKFRITSFDTIELLRCVLFFPMHYLVLIHKKTANFRGSRSQMFFKMGVLKNFAIFPGKHRCWSLVLNFYYKETLR